MPVQLSGTKKRPRRGLLLAGVILVQLLLMGSAFVGGRMLAQQNSRGSRPPGGFQLPSQLPKEAPADTGSVQKITDQVLTIARPGRAPQGGAANANQTEVQVTADTQYFRNTTTGTGAQTLVQATSAKFDDIKVGNTILVWGVKSGSRIIAEVVYIQNAGR